MKTIKSVYPVCRKVFDAALFKERMKTIKSVCPECKKVLDATLSNEKEKIVLEKTCDEHGSFRDVYWSNAELYNRFNCYFYDGCLDSNEKTLPSFGCPQDCGICSEHKTGTLLGNIDVTNRCNLNCPVCFANAKTRGFVYEPDFEQVRQMMLTLRNEKPTPCYAVQFAGGEPTVREDLPLLIETARELGFSHIQIATNGARLAKSQNYCEALHKSGLNTVYMSFDGTSEEPYKLMRGFNAFTIKQKALENCRHAGINSIVLVPTLAKCVNTHQVGDIVRFAAKNEDVVKGVNFQPIAFTGRIDQVQREEQRVTIPDVVELLEEQTEGEISHEAWYPASAAVPVSRFLAAMKKVSLPEFTIHPHCGAATYVFEDRGRLIPINDFVDVDGLLEFLESVTPEFERGSYLMNTARVLRQFPRYIDKTRGPKNINFILLLSNLLKTGSLEHLSNFHQKSLFLGIMHFQDLYNLDLDRIKHCGIHYATPDGKIIPFCTYNNFYREKIEAIYSNPVSIN